MAGLRHDDRCEVLVVAVPAAGQLLITELVDILVDLPRLQVKHLAIIEFNPLDPFELRSHTILLIVVAHVDEDLESAGEKLSVDAGCIVLTVLNRFGNRTVRADEPISLRDVQGFYEFFKFITLREQVVEAVIVGDVLPVEMPGIHLLNAPGGLRDVVQDVLAESGLVLRLELEAARLLAVATEHLDLLSLEVIVVAESPTDGMLLEPLRGGVAERIRKNQVVKIKLERVRVIVIVV